MKYLNKLLALLFVLSTLASHSQNKENPWLIGLGTHGPNMTFGDAKSNYYKNWNVMPAISQVKIFKYMGRGLSIGTQLSLGDVKRYDSVESKFFLQWGIDFKYSLANGYILREKSRFDPYFLLGGGLNKWGDVKGSLNAGAGLNIWFTKNVGLFIQTAYNYMPHGKVSPHANDQRPSFMHHSFGMVLRVGRGADADKDGIPDADDKCPTIPGKAEFDGCPDTDGDGIIDKDDKCPMVAGLAQFMGCPDSDGDGIPDMDDACPTAAGPAATIGCPDKDGDGIADKDDQCPNEKGPAATQGCPDTDGDGIADKDDKCPQVFGLKEFNGCPKPALDEKKKLEVQQKLSFAAQNIFFETGKDILKTESHKQLDSVVHILVEYDFLKVAIDGHTDNVGSDKSNTELSNKRAAAVANYLTAHGIAAGRLTVTGYGRQKPIADNKTAKGRAQNRRVEINIKD